MKDDNLKGRCLIMFKKMLVRFSFGIVGVLATQAAIEKYETALSKRKENKKTIVLESEKVEEEITEDDVQEALAKELKL
jgi:hypothetical protein